MPCLKMHFSGALLRLPTFLRIFQSFQSSLTTFESSGTARLYNAVPVLRPMESTVIKYTGVELERYVAFETTRQKGFYMKH